MKNAVYLWEVLTTPKCWIRLCATNKVLDSEINKALDNPKFDDISSYTVNLNGMMLWIENYPYAFGSVYGNDSLGLPSRRTVFRLRDELIKFRLMEKNNV